ncbi:EGF and SEA domain containing protein-like protein, partial [Dinothrombium tinctorium]
PTKEVYKVSATVVKEVRGGRRKIAREDKYSTHGFKRRKLHQFIDDYNFNFAPDVDILREFTRVNHQASPSISQGDYLAPSEPLIPLNHQPIRGFQRIRIIDDRSNFAQQPPKPRRQLISINSSPNPPLGERFQRVVIRKPDQNRQAGPQSFRRAPVLAPPQPSDNPPIPITPSNPPSEINTAPRRRVNGRPIKRVRPAQNLPSGLIDSTRPVKRIKVTKPSFQYVTRPFEKFEPITPQNKPTSQVEVTTEKVTEKLVEKSTEKTIPKSTEANVPATAPTNPSRRIVRVRKPLTPGSGQQGPRRIVLKGNRIPNNEIPARGIGDDDSARNNAVDGADNSIAGIETKVKDEMHLLKGLKPEGVKLNYLTKFTYLTTVIRGEHTLITTRESSTTSEATSTFDAGLMNLLEKSKGIVASETVVNLGTRTKGPTTTIVNLQSEITIANIEPLKIIPTKASSIQQKPTSIVRKPLFESSPPSLRKIDIKQLNAIPKTYYTQFIYFYTVYDRVNTRKSTRSEVVSTTLNSDNPLNIKVDKTVDGDGFISLGSGPETVNLGKREFAGTTTEVNLAMQSFLRLDGVSNVIVETGETEPPTQVFTKAHSPSQDIPRVKETRRQPVVLETSFSTDIATGASTATPPIEGTLQTNSIILKTRKPIRIANTDLPRDIVRSRLVLNGRPGVRIRSRPLFNRNDQKTTSSVDLTPNLIVESTPTLHQSSVHSSQPISNEVINKDSESSIVEPSQVTTSKRPIAVTIRKPFGSLNRFRTRRPTQVQPTTEPKFVVVTRSGPVGLARPTLNRFRVASRVIRPTTASSSSSVESTTLPDNVPTRVEPSFTTMTSVNEKGETLSIAVTTVPVIFGLETSYRTVTLTSTLPSSSTPTTQLPQHKPSPLVFTYFTTNTHTVPFTIGNQTFYTTFTITDSRVVTETQPFTGDPSARANKFTKASNGVTLIVTDTTRVEPTIPITLEPTLVTGASVVMKDNIRPQIDDKLYDTLTLFTTFTYFTTYYQDTTSTISSSEKVVSNVIKVPRTDVPIIESTESSLTPYTVVETSEKIDRSTIYSTMTFFATLFNGSQSTITPIEETKTEILTLTEPIKITRTIYPSQATQQSSIFTRTYYTTYTNLVTFLDNNVPVTSEIKETVSNIVTYTIPGYQQESTKSPSSSSSNQHPFKILPSLTTRNTYTTLTHYITLFSGSNTILSSIEEVSPTVVTEVIGETQAPKVDITEAEGFKIQKTYGDHSSKPSRDLMTAFVPSVSTLFTTHTYFTTFFSGTTSFISSREETSSSLVTLYVPYSVALKTSHSVEPSSIVSSTQSLPSVISESSYFENEKFKTDQISVEPTPLLPSSVLEEFVYSSRYPEELKVKSISQLPSLRVESSKFEDLESSIISSVYENLKSSQGLSEEQISSVIFNIDSGKSTTTIDGSTIVFFTDLVFKPGLDPTSVSEIVPTHSQQLGDDKKEIDNKVISSIIDKVKTSIFENMPVSSIVLPSEPESASPSSETIKPGSVIELSDILGGSNTNLTGNLGSAIKDIVQLIAAGANKLNNQKNLTDIDRVESSKVILPLGGVTIMHSKDPIYIPIGAVGNNNTKETQNLPPIAPVFNPSIPTFESSSVSKDSHVPVYIPPMKDVPIEEPKTEEVTQLPSPVYKQSDESKVKPAASTPRKSQLNFRRFEDKRKETKKEEIVSSFVEPSMGTEESRGVKSTPILSLPDASSFIPHDGSKAIFTQISSGATTIFFVDAPESTMSSESKASDQKTKYVTSVESITRTLTLTTTKVYYTRDSPLTITSEFTTTIPPRTFVSTIIGSRTILGTAGEATKTVDIEPSNSQQAEATTKVTTTTLIFNSITTTVVRTLVIPTAIEPTKPVASGTATKSVTQRPTKRPVVPYRGRVRPSTTPKPIPIKPPRPRTPYVYKKPTTSSTPSYLENDVSSAPKFNSEIVTKGPDKILDDDQCRPACNAAGNEICKEFSGKYRCDCRPGFARKESNSQCEEIQSYILIVRIMKVNETPVAFKNEFADKTTSEFQEFAKMTEKEIDRAYKLTSLKDNYIGATVNQINKTSNGVLVNCTIHLSDNDELNEDLLLDELTKSFEESESLPVPAAISAEVENVVDLDECSDKEFNDCDPTARCINEIGSYKCECKDGFPDLNPALPGRTCAAEIKNCELCHSRGDCVRSENGDGTVCKCQRMYLGRHCEINGICKYEKMLIDETKV